MANVQVSGSLCRSVVQVYGRFRTLQVTGQLHASLKRRLQLCVHSKANKQNSIGVHVLCSKNILDARLSPDLVSCHEVWTGTSRFTVPKAKYNFLPYENNKNVQPSCWTFLKTVENAIGKLMFLVYGTFLCKSKGAVSEHSLCAASSSVRKHSRFKRFSRPQFWGFFFSKTDLLTQTWDSLLHF